MDYLNKSGLSRNTRFTIHTARQISPCFLGTTDEQGLPPSEKLRQAVSCFCCSWKLLRNRQGVAVYRWFFPPAAIDFPGDLQPPRHLSEAQLEKTLIMSFCYQKNRSTSRWLVCCIWNPQPGIFQENGSGEQQITWELQDDCLIFWKDFLKTRVGGEKS